MNTFNILGIDPGITNMGLASTTVNAETRLFENISTSNISLGDIHIDNRLDVNFTHGERFSKLLAFQEWFRIFLLDTKPDMVVIEESFFNPGRPVAFRSLVEVMQMIRMVVVNYNIHLPVITFSPMEIKKVTINTLYRKTTTDKASILEALSSVNNILMSTEDSLNNKTEHELDAIAAVYTYLRVGDNL